jgi:hypothetical protein
MVHALYQQPPIDFLDLSMSQFSKQRQLIRRPRAVYIDFSKKRANSDEKWRMETSSAVLV